LPAIVRCHEREQGVSSNSGRAVKRPRKFSTEYALRLQQKEMEPWPLAWQQRYDRDSSKAPTPEYPVILSSVRDGHVRSSVSFRLASQPVGGLRLPKIVAIKGSNRAHNFLAGDDRQVSMLQGEESRGACKAARVD